MSMASLFAALAVPQQQAAHTIQKCRYIQSTRAFPPAYIREMFAFFRPGAWPLVPPPRCTCTPDPYPLPARLLATKNQRDTNAHIHTRIAIQRPVTT